MKRYLSVDGGGIMGVSLAHALKYIEDIRRRELHFDGYAGTSVGSIIASHLAAGYPVKWVKNLMDQDGRKVFQKWPFFQRFNPKKPKYNNEFLKEKLEETLGDIKFKDLKVKLVIPVCGTLKNKAIVYSNELTPDELVRDAVLRSAAAPTYFPTILKMFTDGGLIANNPVAVLGCLLKATEDYRILSMGTGFDHAGRLVGNMTKIGWLNYILRWLTSAGGLMTFIAKQYAARINELKESLGVKKSESSILRLIPMSEKMFDMDDFSKIDEQKALWENYINENQEEVLEFLN